MFTDRVSSYRDATLFETAVAISRDSIIFFIAKVKQVFVSRLWTLRHSLHTNACGDFTLLSKEHWLSLRGYPEWEIFSWHIDSVFLYQADQNGVAEIDLPERCRVYHIEHGKGSGYTPEGANILFDRLKSKEIAYIDWPQFLQIVAEMDRAKKRGERTLYNSASWGMANVALPEIEIGQRTIDKAKGIA